MKKSNELIRLYTENGICKAAIYNRNFGYYRTINFILYDSKRAIINTLRRQYDCVVPARALKR